MTHFSKLKLAVVALAAAVCCGSAHAATAARPPCSVVPIGQVEELANQGDAAAQICLGDRLMVGDGVAQDWRAAAAWYSKASRQGNAEGHYKLGLAFDRGAGVERGASEAQQYLQASADQAYMTGDTPGAVRGYTIAASQGDTWSQSMLRVIEWEVQAGSK